MIEGLIVGSLCILIYAFGGFFIDLGVSLGCFESLETSGLGIGTLFAFAALVGMLLVGGMIITYVLGFFYNIHALFIGGIKIEVQKNS